MRKITEQMSEAFKARTKKSNGNTTTDGTSLFLHGNEIARHTPTPMGGVWITLAGWPSPTTKERLNGLLGVLGLKGGPSYVGIHQKKGVQYLGSHGETVWSMQMDPDVWYFVPFDGTPAWNCGQTLTASV